MICWIAASVRVFGVVPRKQAFVFAIASVLAACVTVEMVDHFRHLRAFPAYPMFPSGHEAFTTSVGTSTVIADRRWLGPAIVIGIIMAPVLVLAGFHKWPDVIASAVLSPLITLAFHRLFNTKVPQWQPMSSSQ